MLRNSKGSGSRPIYRGTETSDDVFAFGTILFETFAGKTPLENDGDASTVSRILSNKLPDVVKELDATTVRKCQVTRFGPNRPAADMEEIGDFHF